MVPLRLGLHGHSRSVVGHACLACIRKPPFPQFSCQMNSLILKLKFVDKAAKWLLPLPITTDSGYESIYKLSYESSYESSYEYELQIELRIELQTDLWTDRVANVKNQPPNFKQLIPCAWRAHWCLNNRTLKLHFQAYIASELHRNCFTWLTG